MVLVFDRPFVFAIQHAASGTRVFVGVVMAPQEVASNSSSPHLGL